jgi:hypothetical protein
MFHPYAKFGILLASGANKFQTLGAKYYKENLHKLPIYGNDRPKGGYL